ncbi:NADH-quinone oxidoreductase subunit NuoN [Anoxybacillus kestanbolensis]|uniref:NADH-quinone oxidoreductase subunit NuoN n=1 Tax=Anoxybacillus kestanbolensis TaxID=227476 RepID=UPI003D1B3541
MDFETLLSYQWGVMMPEFIILGVAVALSLIDLFMPEDRNRRLLGLFAFVGVAVSFVSLLGLWTSDVTSILGDTFRLDSFAKSFKALLLIGSALVLLLAIHYEPNERIAYRGEFYYLFLTALLGAMMMASSGDLITLFVGLELLSISSYILVAIRKKHTLANEAALKYVITGSIATAITLFGMSYIFGFTGSTNIKEIAQQLASTYDENHQYILSVAFLLTFVGLSFKLASAPFHMWAPDVYQGATTPVVSFLSVVSKTAGFIIVLRLIVSVFAQTPIGNSASMLMTLAPYIAFLAGATMIIGNTIALRQRNVKRMLAYSSVAHAGYVLVAFASLSMFMFEAIWFYLLAYLFMTIGAFAILQVVSQHHDDEDISIFAGLYRRSPLMAVAMTIFLLSLAGIPGTAGFIGKMNIFLGAFVVEPAHYVLASIMVITTVISYVYYFGIFVQMFFRPVEHTHRLEWPPGVIAVVVICVIGTVLLGVLPNIAYDFLAPFEHFSDFLQ